MGNTAELGIIVERRSLWGRLRIPGTTEPFHGVVRTHSLIPPAPPFLTSEAKVKSIENGRLTQKIHIEEGYIPTEVQGNTHSRFIVEESYDVEGDNVNNIDRSERTVVDDKPLSRLAPQVIRFGKIHV